MIYNEVRMIIYDIKEKGKFSYVSKLFIPGLIILVNLGLFGGWKLHTLEAARTPLTIDTSNVVLRSTNIPAEDQKTVPSLERTTGKYVGSRGGRSYYLLTCSGAKRISEKNKIFFDTKEEAEKFGYKPAKTCKGI